MRIILSGMYSLKTTPGIRSADTVKTSSKSRILVPDQFQKKSKKVQEIWMSYQNVTKHNIMPGMFGLGQSNWILII